MKHACFLPLAILPILLFAQTDFTVSPGSQRTLTAAERTLSLKTLSLGDNSTIIIPPMLDGWTVSASDATIGSNVKIIGQGAKGSSMAFQTAAGTNGATCMPGMNGTPGANGENGGAGKNISLDLRIRKMGKLTINVNGGDGGYGGTGGNGGKGGNASCNCSAGGNGGNGGSGGAGGSGGKGGDVIISYAAIGNTAVTSSNFEISNNGGAGARGGNAGSGGAGGLGGGCAQDTPKSAVRPAGAYGKSGAQGAVGVAGAKGSTSIEAKQ